MAEQDLDPVEASPEPVDDERNIEETALFFETTPQTVRAWLLKGCPAIEKGSHGKSYRLSLRAVDAWRKGEEQRKRDELAERARQVSEADSQLRMQLLGDALPELELQAGPMTARARKEMLEAEVSKAKLMEMRGELVRADDIQSALARVLQVLSLGLRSIPDQLAGELGLAEEVTVGMIEGINRLLDDLATSLEQIQAGDLAAILGTDDAGADESAA